jgi:hypothetical protein
MEGVQPAIAHPPTQAALAAGRARAVRTLRIAVVLLVVGLVVFVPSWTAGEEGERAGTLVTLARLLGSVLLFGAGAAVVLGANGLWRAAHIGRVLGAEPWHVVGPSWWQTINLGVNRANRRAVLVAVARPTTSPLRARVLGLPPGWPEQRTGQAERVWLAGPVDEWYVLGTADGQGLALAKEPSGYRRMELGRHLDAMEPG